MAMAYKCEICGKKWGQQVFSFANVEKTIPVPRCNCAELLKEKEKQQARFIEKKRKIKALYIQAGFSRRLRPIRLKNINSEHKTEAETYLKNFTPKRSRGLFFIGPPGNGKTTLATCIGKELVAQGGKVIIKTFNDYLGEMQRAEFAKDYKDKSWLLNQWTSKDLIIIDDFGREKYTDNRLVNTFTFFDKLVNENTCFIMTANPESTARIKDLPEFSAIFDRIVGDCKILKFKNASFRRINQ